VGQVEADLLAAINQAYLIGRQGDFSARVVQQLLTVGQGADITPPLHLDEAQLYAAIDRIAAEVRRPGRAATQIGDIAIAAAPGVEVDVEATIGQVLAALQTGGLQTAIDAPLVTIEQDLAEVAQETPSTGAARPEAVQPAAPLLLSDEQFGLAFALDAVAVSELILSREPLQLQDEALRGLLETWATQIEIPARDARLRFNAQTGGLTVIQTSQHGRELDIDATSSSIREALAANQSQAKLVVLDVAPAVDEARLAEMGIHELVASGTTYFRGSSAARIRNIEVAAEKFDGVVIPPDGIFSFNTIVENVTSANGFEDSLIIWGDQTVVGVGGGVCQVSTTVFRAAYNAGLPIVERYNHGYIVDWYGEPGLDATIFTPTVDLKFRNDTGAYLLIEPVVDGINGEITFNFYGTRPERVVTIGAPVKSDIENPESPTYVVDESLAPDQQKQVEWEKPGMTVTVQRTIVENGTTRTDTLTSRYVPWRAQYLVGPGVEIPATPTPDEETPPAEEAPPAAADATA
jgi:vancomycin resistance protein YoaR